MKGFSLELGIEFVARQRDTVMNTVSMITAHGPVNESLGNMAITDMVKVSETVNALMSIVESDNSDIANSLRELRHMAGHAQITIRNSIAQ